MVTSAVVLKAEDIAHVLRDCIALLPGSRDRNGRAIIIFPPKEQQLNPDNIRNILRYLHTVTADEARDLGFTVIIDMRGKHAYNNVRPILKAINVHMISIDALAKFVDSNQLIRDLGGSFPYDHDDWLDTRLSAEVNIAQVTNIAVRLRSIGGQSTRNKLERMKLRLEEEWARFQEQLLRRKLILNAAVAFFIATKMYFNQLPSWIESPGVDPAVMNGKTAEILEEAIQQHETFWVLVEETYAE
ncbi:hypothetical protein ANCDUO_14198, partial [Ancylostoma duodenale]